MPELLAGGKLREAKAAAMQLPADAGLRAEAMRDVEAAQRRLDQLIAAARAALAGTDEARAEALLKDAALISAEDAAAELATVPLPPPADLRATEDGIAVQLFWRPATGPRRGHRLRRSGGRRSRARSSRHRKASRCTATAVIPAPTPASRWPARCSTRSSP